MSAITVVLLAFAVTAGIIGLDFWFNTRTWIAFWRGHRVVLRLQQGVSSPSAT